ncbi:MAG: hydrogenase 3 maturation endopeptidase HyCI [Acidobacteriota bacterium]
MLEDLLRGKVVFVGVGNPLLGDDGFGPSMARGIPGAINAGSVPENFASKISREKPDTVVIFDAVDFGGRAGEIRVFDPSDTRSPNVSTHSLPLSKFAEALKPATVLLVGIQPRGITFGEPISEEVAAGANALQGEIGGWLKRKPPRVDAR